MGNMEIFFSCQLEALAVHFPRFCPGLCHREDRTRGDINHLAIPVLWRTDLELLFQLGNLSIWKKVCTVSSGIPWQDPDLLLEKGTGWGPSAPHKHNIKQDLLGHRTEGNVDLIGIISLITQEASVRTEL